MARTKNGDVSLWYLSIVASFIACVIAGWILYFGYVDLQEGNAAWLKSGPDYVPKGNIAVRTVWGVLAMLFCPIAFLLLFLFARSRSRFAALPIAKQWLLAIGAPMCLVIVLISLCAIGVIMSGPIIIPYPAKPQEAPNHAMHRSRGSAVS
jgi:hypothetical protein